MLSKLCEAPQDNSDAAPAVCPAGMIQKSNKNKTSGKMTDVIIPGESLAEIAALATGWWLIRLRVNKIARLSQGWESILCNSTNIYSL